jgi:hypothetical protein
MKMFSAFDRNVLVVASLGATLALAGCNCSEGPGLSRLRAQIKVPDHLDFGEVPLGATSQLPVTVENKGNNVLHVCLENSTLPDCVMKTHIDPSGSPYTSTFDNPDMTMGQTWIVDKGLKRDFNMSFTPVNAGEADAKLIIAHDASNGPTTTITLTGKGVAPNLGIMPQMIDFGEVTVGQKKSVDLVITNMTQFAQPVTLGPIMEASQIFGTNNGMTDTPANMPLMVNAPGNGTNNGMLTIKVWYIPPDEGMHMNTLHVSYCPTCTLDIPLSGKGIKPAMQIMPASLDFGMVDIGSNATRMFTIKNVGNVNLTINQIGPDSATSTDFSAAPMMMTMLPAMIPPMGSMVVNAVYAPHSGGQKMGRIEVDSNAWDDPTTPQNESIGYVAVNASGTGAAITPVPASINFGTVPLNGPAVARNLILENSGTSPLMINSIMLNTPTPEVTIRMMPTLPAMVPAGGSIMASFAYLPTNAGMVSAHAIIGSSDRATPMLDVPMSGIGGTPNTCAISVAPSIMNFGLVERGHQATLPAQIHNGGMQPCNVTGLALSGAPQFTLAMPGNTMFTIPPGSTQRVDIKFLPDNYGTYHSLLKFNSDDPGQMMVQVPVDGSSAQTDLVVVPSSLDFGVVPAGGMCRSPNKTVTLYNTGASPITIMQVYLDPTTPTTFELTPYPTPTTIQPGASSVITLRYHPVNIGMETGVLFIQASVSMTPVAVPLSGDGENAPVVTDTFHQAASPEADILFVIDDSGSMSYPQTQLATNIMAFTSFATMQSIDYHIAVTTTDVEGPNSPYEDPLGPHANGGEQGAFVGNPKFITPQTANGQMTFSNTVNSFGTSGSALERGLEAAYLALSDPKINTVNAGFLRQEAALAVIVVSDDDDTRDDCGGDPINCMNPNPGGPNEVLVPGARPIDFYVNFFRNIKGFQNTTAFSFNAIVETTEQECMYPDGNQPEASGYRYMQVAMQTGGVVGSICSQTWNTTLNNIGLNSFGLRRQFPLSSAPVPATIAVSVNGSPAAAGSWSYDGNSNSVVFTAGSAPPAGATITVTYSVACGN